VLNGVENTVRDTTDRVGDAVEETAGTVTETVRGTTGTVTETVGGTTGAVTDTLGNVLEQTSGVRDAAGRPRDPKVLELDHDGARVVRGVVLALALSDQGRSAAAALSIGIGSSEQFTSLGLAVTKLELPEGMSATSAVASLRAADPAGIYDYDHVYDPTGDGTAATRAVAKETKPGARPRIGMIDSGIELDHPALRDGQVETKNTVEGIRGDHPSVHGTAVASLLVGQDRDFQGALPGAALFAADAFCGAADGGAADDIARALAWLVEKEVPVINVSMAGPKNALLEAAVRATIARGHVVVASVGNDGPAVGVRYPAAYQGVVAVTSVDANDRVQIDANRGPEVAFAARGVGVRAATLSGGYGTVTGTSFATPVVAGRFAALVPRPDKGLADGARAKLISAVRAPDKTSHDLAYGYGIVEIARP
jgi:hypothetical protein